MIKKPDLVLIAACAALAGILFFWFGYSAPGGAQAVVEQNGEELYRITLAQQKEEQILDLGGPYHVKLLLQPGAVSFLSSDCPDQVCVRTGRLTKSGQVAVCLPARVAVRLENAQAEFDGFTG